MLVANGDYDNFGRFGHILYGRKNGNGNPVGIHGEWIDRSIDNDNNDQLLDVTTNDGLIGL